MLKLWYQKMLTVDTEKQRLLSFVKKYAKENAKIVDVGCGYGRYLLPLKNGGYNILGVEQNEEIVNKNLANGLDCISVADFEKTDTKYDIIICAHIIEHFTPTELFKFMNYYMSRLQSDGYLIIATPLYTHYFYDDFDHIKPYHPAGLQMVFGGNGSQVQYYSPFKLLLKDIWFRRSPLTMSFHRAKFFKTPMTRFIQLYEFIMALIYRMSFQLIAKKDGWIGIYQKCE